jgi:hypothetical protein
LYPVHSRGWSFPNQAQGGNGYGQQVLSDTARSVYMRMLSYTYFVHGQLINSHLQLIEHISWY